MSGRGVLYSLPGAVALDTAPESWGAAILSALARIEPCAICGASVSFHELELAGGTLAYRVVAPPKAWIAIRVVGRQKSGVLVAVKAFCSGRCAGAYSLLERDPSA